MLSGGYSTEREVSLRSGAAVLAALQARGHDAKGLDLLDLLPGGTVTLGELATAADVVFLALHGAGGEDGCVQGMLELAGLPYTGSGVLASATAMDKAATKRVYRSSGLPVAPDQVVSASELHTLDLAAWVSRLEGELGWPVVLKAVGQGSTHGIEVVRGPEGMTDAWARVSEFGEDILVERFIRGREFTVSVWGDVELQALPVVEIVPKVADYFTLEAKYQPGGADEIVPARLPAAVAERLADLGMAAHRALGCLGVSRTDILLDDEGHAYLLETNTLPGLTEGSLLPKALRAAGWDLGTYAERMIAWALARGIRQGGRT